jgi:hypothetical protein
MRVGSPGVAFGKPVREQNRKKGMKIAFEYLRLRRGGDENSVNRLQHSQC